MSRCLFCAMMIALEITACLSVNISNLPDELWQRTLTFVDMRQSDAADLRTLDRRTYRFYDPDYVAVHRLESTIYSLESINDTVDYDMIWTLTKQIQLSSIGDVQLRAIRVHRHVVTGILAEQTLFDETPKARRLMHALGFRSISIHEYNDLTLDVDHWNITESGKYKLKLLLLASRGSEPFLTAMLNGTMAMDEPASMHTYNHIVNMHDSAGFPVWVWYHFPWIAAPANSCYQTHTFLLYFGALYEFLWTRFHHEFGFPKYDSMFYISDLDESDTVKQLDFVKFADPR